MRLRVCYERLFKGRVIISIPSGAIKSAVVDREMLDDIVISIPSGAIKSGLPSIAALMITGFQFLLVRLRGT